MSDLINQSVIYGGDCRTAPATPGLLKKQEHPQDANKSQYPLC